jgi:hypothetical protein
MLAYGHNVQTLQYLWRPVLSETPSETETFVQNYNKSQTIPQPIKQNLYHYIVTPPPQHNIIYTSEARDVQL